MSISAGALGQDGGDPRLSILGDEKHGQLGGVGISAYTRKQLLGIRDPNVKFEE